jgi:hypothetical protein
MGILASVGSLDPATAADTAPWGKPVDGLACRLVVQSRYVIGEPITAVVEVKNTSDKTRYLVPRLDPQAIEHLAVEILGPTGQKVHQSSTSWFVDLSESSFEALAPGAIKRFEIVDLRAYFSSLGPCYPDRTPTAVATGTYRLQCRFRSPKVPASFRVAQSIVNGKTVSSYKKPAAELVAGQWAGEVTSAPVAFQLLPLGKDDLVVHEWGVFTVFNEGKYANANRKEEWGSLPSFFYRQFPKERLRWVPSGWDKPIVYFYTPLKALRVNVKVTFAEGAPVVWWPAAADPVEDPFGGRTGKNTRPFRALTWEAWVGERAPAPGRTFLAPPPATGEQAWVKVKEFPLPAGCWLAEARLADAALLTVIGNDPTAPRRFPGSQDRPETERFLYYDGLVPAPDYVRCDKVTDTTVVLRNQAKFDLTRMFVVDRRAAGTVRFAYVQPFKAGATRTIEPRSIAAADWPATGTRQVRQALLEAGLFKAEADALLKIWHKRLLEAEGVTVFHLLPAAEYDRMLPLSIYPAPAARPVRVGIALHPHMEIEPDLAAQVAVLIRQLDAPTFKKRAAASKELLEIGPLAIARLRAELQKGPSLEVSQRIEAILERVDAAAWLKLPPTKKTGPR